jgi:hypothetical protein
MNGRVLTFSLVHLYSLFTKFDLLEKKLASGIHFNKYFVSYGGRPNDAPSVISCEVLFLDCSWSVTDFRIRYSLKGAVLGNFPQFWGQKELAFLSNINYCVSDFPVFVVSLLTWTLVQWVGFGNDPNSNGMYLRWGPPTCP